MSYDFSNDDLATYLRFLNGDKNGPYVLTDDGTFNLTEDLDHWRAYGITTATQLGDYLDECVEKERRADNIVECDDDPYYRECMASDTGDDMSKADYIDYYSRMGMEGDY